MATFAATSRGLASALLMLLGIGMGLAVPATGMAVMASVPVERAGIASATMNALRQAGMSLGIALLGSLMGQRAVQQFAASAQAAGQPGLAAQARELILQPGSMHATPRC
jgi:MFS family permease